MSENGVPAVLRPGQPLVLPALLLAAMDPTFAQELCAQARQGHEADAKDCGWYPTLTKLDAKDPVQALILLQLLPKAADCGLEKRREEAKRKEWEARRQAEKEEKERLEAEKEARRQAEEKQRKQRVRRRWIIVSSLGLVVVFAVRFCVSLMDQVMQEKAHQTQAEQEKKQQESTRIMEEELSKTMVLVKGGSFQMGSPETEKDQRKNERQHLVTVKDFKIGKYEVTQAQWRAVMGSDLSYFNSYFKGCDDCPVEQVSWIDIQDFLGRLNAKTGQTYRLPTEAEWEYACRSGGKAELYCGGADLDRLGWYDGNSGGKTHPVGQKAPNGLGLYDMSGNVLEWTCSAYVEGYDGSETGCSSKINASSRRVGRGGSWRNTPGWVRSADRSGGPPGSRLDSLGFRLAQDKMP